MKDIVSLIQNAEDFCALGSADLTKIHAAENALELTFANDYISYVMAFGAASFDARELTGVCDSKRLSVISVTEHARNYFPKFPRNAYVVEEMLIDHIITIQTADGHIFSYGPSDKATLIANSLQEYLFPESDVSPAP